MLAGCLLLALIVAPPVTPIVTDVPHQPLASQAGRVAEALEFVGEPLSAEDRRKLADACRATDESAGVRAIQEILDRRVLCRVDINPESRVKAAPGPAERRLVQNGWRNFLVKVVNDGGVTAPLRATSPNSAPMVRPATNRAEPPKGVTLGDVPHRFLDLAMFNNQPLTPTLTGFKLEYRILQLYCRDAGPREAILGFDVGQGTQDAGFRGELAILFESAPGVKVTLRVADHNGAPVTASFLFRDRLGRVLPSQARRLAPDFFFHPQVYRADGEHVVLPPGDYTVEYTRGPEYRVKTARVNVPAGKEHTLSFKLERWIELRKLGWWSGDHHVHAAGCAHYDAPTEGVGPEDMMRHILGEDLNVGCVLSWGPCWYHQKAFFEGKTHSLSQPNYLMRYDVEVSGFPSSHAGHLCLLNLKEDDYPNTKRIEDWPSWNDPIFRWAKSQGGVTGYSHSAFGLEVGTEELPNFEVPKFTGIGANEFIVNAPLGTCDFISTVDTMMIPELNIWYHTLNAGCTTRISGETDFPCIYGQRVGIGRVYVKLDGPLSFEPWVLGLKAGRSYVSDGFGHLPDFQVGGIKVGEDGGVLRLKEAGKVKVTAGAAALLPEKPDPSIGKRPLWQSPYWHVERARIGAGRKVPVEVIVNGYPVARSELEADGSLRPVEFDVPLARSSWVALRIWNSAHTNPVFVEIDGKPIRASRKSLQWCAAGVEACWKAKSPLIRPSERPAARKAYDEAAAIYRARLAEAVAD